MRYTKGDPLKATPFEAMISISAPGKLMLLGEHAILYGQPCIVTAIDRRLTVSIEQTSDRKVAIDAPQAGDTRFVEAAVRVGCQTWGIRHKGLRIQTQSELGAYGFGSSSAATVATLEALRLLFHREVEKQECFNVAKQVVLAVQGAGSGFDVAAAIYGRTLYFVTGGKIIEPLDFQARFRESNDQTVSEIPLVVGYTGVKADTVALIKQVAEKKEKNPQKVDRIFQAIAKLVEEVKVRMLEGDWERVGKLMDFNQEYLRDLGVSSEKLEALISAAKKAGAFGAKLSGAGGGDCMIALHPDGAQGKHAIAKAIRDADGEVVDVSSNAEGVRVETTDDQNELFTVVDEQDHVVDYKTRYECHHNPHLIHRTIGILLFDTQGRLLLQKRSASKDIGGGLWGISTGGHVLKGEDYIKAAERELWEELGVRAALEELGTYLMKTMKETEMSRIYKAQSLGPFQLHPYEVERVEWVDPKKLSRKILSREIALTDWSFQVLQKTGVLP